MKPFSGKTESASRAKALVAELLNAQSDARRTVEKFRALDKKNRDAVVKFIEEI